MDETSKELRKRVTRARSQLVIRKPFFGYLALHLEPKEKSDMSIPTMATNGKFLFYDPNFVQEHIPEELQGVIVHEVIHCALGHLWRKGARDGMRWNLAADYVTNLIVTQEGFMLPKGIFLDYRFTGMSIEEVYEKITDDDAQSQSTLDDHDQWDANGNGEEGLGDELNEALGGDSGDESSHRAMEQQWRQNISRARQMAKMQGEGMGSMDSMVDELLEPRINWKEMLRSMLLTSIPSDFRLIPPNKKHLWRGYYLPSSYGESIEIAVAIDTSGSMSNDDVAICLNEVRSVCQQFKDYRIHYLQCDDGIQDYQEVTPYVEFTNRIHGRGGTSFVPVFEAICDRALNVSCLVYFTDMMGTFPDTSPNYPVIWISTSRISDAPFGHVVVYER